MSIYFLRFLLIGCALLAACSNSVNNPISAQSDAGSSPSNPMVSSTTQMPSKAEQTAIFAGGCFWGVEAVFEHVKGVTDVTSGFSVGKANPSDSEIAKEEKTRHAETVKITFDPSKISYEQLLKIFFLIAHDPTELNRQGPDVGAEYRSAIFYSTEEQKQLAESYIAELTAAKNFAQPIVTQIVALDSFNAAGDEHQNYMARHPDEAYIVINDKPRLENLRRQFPDLFVSK